MSEIGQDEWEKAFAAYGLDAASGRLFRGLAHNINGAAQAFSMQGELLQMLFTQAAGLLAQVENAATLEEAKEAGRKLQVMLERRATLAGHLEREVRVVRETMARCSGLVAAAANPADGGAFSLAELLETELEFLNGDGFFKHKVRKDLALAAELPPLRGHLVEVHQVVAALLENAAQAMQAALAEGQTSAVLAVNATLDGPVVKLAISDNGQGIAPGQQERLFAPFYSTRPGRLGLGLWLARRLAARFGGEIACESGPGRTTFTLTIPVSGETDGGR